MAADNVDKFRIRVDKFNAEGMTDENSLSNAFLLEPSVLSMATTFLAGREDMRFPLSFLTEGMKNVKRMNNIEYRYPVMGRMDKAVMATGLTGSGIGHSRFKIIFAEKWFVRQYIIESPDGLQARIMEDPVETDEGWEYTCQLNTTDSTASVTATDVVGKLWSQMWAPVAESGSRGNESNFVTPSEMQNQMSIIRKSYRYEGNMPDRVVNISLPNGKGGTSEFWYPFEEWQHLLKWKEEAESLYWYSQYNRDANGVINMMDDNGKPIPMGSGVLEQIPNYDSYSSLTASKLKNTVRDALYGASDAQKMNVTLFTGTGGLEEFDTAMKDDLAGRGYVKTSPTFVTGSGRNMTLGGFFTSYEHIDGHKINVRKLPLFNHGKRALNSRKHPVTGLPLESYRMVFLDMSQYDGEANVYMVTQKGREFIRGVVQGFGTPPPGFKGNSTIATDKDGSSIHFMKTAGIAIRRATNCMHLECVAE